MDKNTITGLLLIIAILIGYSIWSSPSKEEIARMQRQRDSIFNANQEEQARLKEELRKSEEQARQSYIDADDSHHHRERQNQFGIFAHAINGKDSIITMENELMKLNVSTKGGRPYSVELKEYKRHDKSPLILFDGDSTVFGFKFFTKNHREIATNNLYFKPLTEERHIHVASDSATLVMRLNAGDTAYIEYRYTMKPEDYMVDFDVNMVNMNNEIASNQSIINFDWQVYSPRQEKGSKNENQYTSLFYKYHQEDIEQLSSVKDSDSKEVRMRLDWVVFKQQFFSWGLIAKQNFANADLQFAKQDEYSRFTKKFDALIGMRFETNQDNQTIPMSLYFGPNHYNALKEYGIGLEQLVFLGRIIIRGINRFVIIPMFNWLGKFVNSYGIIILLMTIIIKVCLLPLTFKSFMSSARMRVLKPQIDEINQRIPKEKAMERQQAVMALYKKVGVSPMGGCLPMLLQFPILFAMFRFFPTSIELRQQSFLWATDLSTYDSILDLPFTIPFYGDHVSLFTLLMTVTTIFSMRISSGQTDTSAMPAMKYMMYFMPVMLLFVLNSFSAGLTYYYFVSNLFTILQNEIFKRSIDESKILAQLHANSAKPVKKSKFQQRLEQIQKQQQQTMTQAKRKPQGKKK